MNHTDRTQSPFHLKKHLILIKGEDQTEQVIRISRMDDRIQVTYRSGKSYRYAAQNVEYFTAAQIIPIKNKRVSIKGHLIYDVSEILRFGDWARVFRGDNRNRIFRFSDISLSPITDSAGLNTDLLCYYRELAAESTLKTEEGEALLARKFQHLNVVNKTTILARFLKGKSPQNEIFSEEDAAGLIFPFGCNRSQKLAVQNAFKNPVSVIQGPPGTGKTQTILNLIANLLMQEKSVAIVSNNNAATANVLEKLQHAGLDFIGAFLGSSCNKQEFINNQRHTPISLPNLKQDEISTIRKEIRTLNSTLDEAFDKKNKLADAIRQRDALVLELKHFEQYENEWSHQTAMQEKVSVLMKTSSDRLMKHWIACEQNIKQTNPLSEKYKRNRTPIRFFEKISLYFQLGRAARAFFDVAPKDRITLLQKAYYLRKTAELEHRINSLQQDLADFHFEEKLNRLSTISMQLLKHHLSRKYQNRDRKIFKADDLWKAPEKFLKEYPVVMSTTFSVITSVRNGYRFNCVIVDEASQVDLLNGALTMSCAERLVVVGDLMQLPHVLSNENRKRAEEIGRSYAVPDYARFERHSLLSSVLKAFPGIPATLLREHYRCHPRIIQFCNQKFYNNELIIMTEDRGEEDVLKVYVTVEGNHARGTVNQRQIDEIATHVLPELKGIPPEDIGIVSPYRAQTELTRTAISSSGIEIDTVHKYQGREKPAMILTTVANQTNAFIDDPNLLNVAISRAQQKLRLVTSKKIAEDEGNIADFIRYIRYNNGEVIPGRVRSVFDLLYRDYAEARMARLRSRRRISTYDSENLIYHELQELLQNSFRGHRVAFQVPLSTLLKNTDFLTEEEAAYARHPWTRCDFLIYSEIDKRPILVIEVDGYAYHRKETRQSYRDTLKNSILKKSGLPLLRLSTIGSNEQQRIKQKLQTLTTRI
ncbi:DUF2726 domain-containing protein [Verrucomicrobia bacterium S94]|nr:DUF2726 domain-containing protein [Verrucomicrobia bacterium S94]